MSFRESCIGVFVLVMFGITLQGCSGEQLPELAEVSGKVTKDGTPLKDAQVTFNPANGGTAPSSKGTTDEKGVYVLWVNQTTKGAALGQHSVSIEYFGEEGAMGEHIPTGDDFKAPDFRPRKFSAEVKAGINNDVNFEFDKGATE